MVDIRRGMKRSKEVLCLGGTVISNSLKNARKFEKKYYQSIGE